jgi:zinc protease
MQAVFLGGLWVEHEAHNGVMNFVAEMLTKGTANRRARSLAEEIESMAGEFNGYAGRSSFGVAVEVIDRDLGQGLDLLADILRASAFEADELEKKRADLLAALKHEDDDLFRVAFTLCTKHLFPNHPYGLKVLGTPKSVRALSRDDLLHWYRRYAVPNNLVLAVVGNVEGEAVRQAVGRLFGSWQPAALEFPPQGRRLHAAHNGPIVHRRNKEQAHIIVGMRGASLQHPDRYALRVLESLLGSQGGRLFVELRERQSLAYTVTARSLEGLDPFIFFVYLATSPEKTEIALAGIKEELRRVRDEGPTAQEVARAKRYLVGSYEIECQKNSALAAMLAFDERYGVGFREAEAYAQNIEAVTPEMVHQVARTYLCVEQSVVVMVGPSPSGSMPTKPSAERGVS